MSGQRAPQWGALPVTVVNRTRNRQSAEAFIGPSPPPTRRWPNWNDPDSPYYTMDELRVFSEHDARWLRWRERQEAKKRAEERKTLPHPNWKNRRHCCVVPVELLKPSSRNRGRWMHETAECGRLPVAWDTTSPRATGPLYGACVHHLEQAITDDPSRSWMWATGQPVDPETMDAELVLYALDSRRNHVR